jgi:hypothetical protein
VVGRAPKLWPGEQLVENGFGGYMKKTKKCKPNPYDVAGRTGLSVLGAQLSALDQFKKPCSVCGKLDLLRPDGCCNPCTLVAMKASGRLK